MSQSRFQRAAILLAAVPFLSAAASAQKSDAEARAEIAFARGLASEWGFVGLSEEVIRELENDGTSSKVAEELGLLKCEIYFVAAKSDKGRADELLQQSISSYEDFIARNQYSDYREDAEANLIKVASYYAKWLAREIETAAGEEAEALQAEMQSVLDGAVDKTGELISGLQDVPPDERTEAQKRKLFELLFNRGELLLEMAKTQEDGTYSFESSFRAFEELVDEAGEASPWGLRAFIGIGDNLTARGEFDEASGYYEFVVEMAITRDDEAWGEARKDMSQDELGQRFLFLQMGTAGLVDSLARAGRPEDAASWGLHFYNVWKREGLNLVQPVGHLALLSVARTLVDAGGVIGGALGTGEGRWFATDEEAAVEVSRARDRRPALDLALTMAQNVNQENRGNTLQLRAQKVISEIITRPGIRVDPEVLFEAAQGEFFEKNYIVAIDAFKRVLSSLEGEDQARRSEIGPKTLWHIGRSFQYEDRTLEAAVAFREAVSDRWRGDPEYDTMNATRYYDTVNSLRRSIKGDAVIDAMFRDAENKAKEMTEHKGAEVVYREAKEKYDNKQIEQALKVFKTVEPAAESYEVGQAFIGVCHYKLDQFEEAIQAFADYINRYLEDPVNTTTDKRKLAKRSDLTSYKKNDWADVVTRLNDFHKRFPQQTSYASAALYRTLIAHTKLSDNASARKVYEEMLKAFPNDRWTGQASTDYYKILKARQEAEPDEAQKMVLEREMAEALEVLNRTSPNPSFNNMRGESRHWMKLQEWAKAEELLYRIKTEFEGSESDTDVHKYVIPDLGTALLRQYKVEDCAKELGPLVDAKQANRNTARTFALALTGWLEDELDDNGQIVIKQAQGAGGTEGFEKATEIINQLAEASEKWEKDWYGYKLDQIYAYYQWGQLDGKKLETARNNIGFLVSNLGAQFKHEQIDEPTRQKFVWLNGQLK
jgi:outer membrane protein assembly factor BamD (BamD/ComL family)